MLDPVLPLEGGGGDVVAVLLARADIATVALDRAIDRLGSAASAEAYVDVSDALIAERNVVRAEAVLRAATESFPEDIAPAGALEPRGGAMRVHYREGAAKVTEQDMLWRAIFAEASGNLPKAV